jgi:hypothetical protein
MEKIMKNHKYYQIACRAYSNMSFYPEERATSICQEYDIDIEQIKTLFPDIREQERAIQGYEKRFIAWLSAKSRCVSSMITGPARFNNRRNEKANNSEHNRSVELLEYLEKLKKVAYKKANPTTDIYSNNPDCIKLLKEKIELLETKQEQMKAENKTKAGSFQHFELTNNRAKIKAVKDRLASIEKIKSFEDKIITFEGFSIRQNVVEMRLQILFESKPEEKVRIILKKNGYKWAPTQNAWQRQLTASALWNFNHILRDELKNNL